MATNWDDLGTRVDNAPAASQGGTLTLPPVRETVDQQPSLPTPLVPEQRDKTVADTAKTNLDIRGATWRPATPDEKRRYGVSQDAPLLINGTGEVKVPEGVQPPPSGTVGKPDPERSAQIETILSNLADARNLAGKRLATGNIAGNKYFQDIPLAGQNAANLAASLQMVSSDLTQQQLAHLNQANGGKGVSGLGNTLPEAQRLAASVANLDQTQSYDNLMTGIDQAEQYYRRALARSKGLDPEDPGVQQQFRIRPTTDTTAGADQSDNRANAMQQPDAGAPSLTISTGSRYVEPTPEQKAAAGKLGAMLVRGLPLDNLRLFAKTNGLDPNDPAIAEAVRQRSLPNSAVAKWIKQNPGKGYPFGVNGANVPLTGIAKVGAEVTGFAPSASAAVEGAADAGSFGLAPDIAGIVGKLTGLDYDAARRDYIHKQEMLADAHPVATTIGNFAGGATSGVAMGVPNGLGGLMKQAALYGGIHGAASSDDPSIEGRLRNSATEALLGTVAAPVLHFTVGGATRLGGGLSRYVRGLFGADPEQLANEAALSRLPGAGRMPEQDTAAARDRAAQQDELGAPSSGATALDRAGQDYLGRLARTSPTARQAADDAVTRAEAALPQQIREDFQSAIHDAAVDSGSPGDEGVADFLNRPVREIKADIGQMAGREFEHAITPIYHEPVPMTEELSQVLTSEHGADAIADALRQPGVTPETKAILRALPRQLRAAESAMKPPPVPLGSVQAESYARAQEQAFEQALKSINLNVEAVWRVRSALLQKAGRMTDGEPAAIAKTDLANAIGNDLAPLYPEWADANKLYASRMRGIDAVDDTRKAFLTNTDNLAGVTSRLSSERGEPERPDGSQALPSTRELAMAGAREAATDAAGKTLDTSGTTIGKNLRSANQQERNRMVFGEDPAAEIEQRGAAKVQNLQTLRRLQGGGTGDAGQTQTDAAMRAGVDVSRHWFGQALVNGLRTIRDLSPEDAGRIVSLYTTPGKADELMADLEKRYGRQKATFIVNRLGAIATAIGTGRAKPQPAAQ